MPGSTPSVPHLVAFGVPGVGEVEPGADLAGLLDAALRGAGLGLAAGDIVVVSSKVVSKAQGRSVAAQSRGQAIREQTLRVVAERVTPHGLTQIVQSRSGPVLAAAGVDASNVPPGTVLLLPQAPDAAADQLRVRLAELTGLEPGQLGVVVSDTAGRPWRDGQTDIAIGASGIRVIDDLRGGHDRWGSPLEVTVRAVADELAALADLVKGKLDGIPAAVVRGLPGLLLLGENREGPDPATAAGGAAALLRDGPGDWFRLGHVEAARAAIGVPPGSAGVDPVSMPAGPVGDRLARAVQVGLAGPDPVLSRWRPDWVWTPSEPDGTGGVLRGRAPADPTAPPVHPGQPDLVALGALAQRIAVAAWAEDLAVEIQVLEGPSLRVDARAAGRQ